MHAQFLRTSVSRVTALVKEMICESSAPFLLLLSQNPYERSATLCVDCSQSELELVVFHLISKDVRGAERCHMLYITDLLYVYFKRFGDKRCTPECSGMIMLKFF